MKDTYSVKFNWYGEVHELFTKAQSTSHAISQALAKFARENNYIRYYVRANAKDVQCEKCKEATK